MINEQRKITVAFLRFKLHKKIILVRKDMAVKEHQILYPTLHLETNESPDTEYRRDRTGQQGGGVLLAINKNFFSDEVEESTLVMIVK